MYTDLVKAGIKPENIIYMTYATNVNWKYNPYPGKMFTESSDTTDGDWAQYGCFNHVDYINSTIIVDVFLGILSGDKEGVAKLTGKENPKVLNAGPEDTVFTYFIDHGGNDMIIVGGDPVHKSQLMDAFKTAHEKKLYGKWVWYMEACHSGSMFRDLPSDWNIYVMTSADATHDADMAFCPPHDTVAGKNLGVCLAGLWDNSFLDYVEKHPKATIGEIFDVVHEDVAETSVQNVSEWGDKTFRELPLSDFFGELPSPVFREEKKEAKGVVPVDMVPKHLAMWRAIRADKSELAEALKEYQEEMFKAAKKEVEVMRLARMVMSEKAAEKAMKMPAGEYSADCVKELTMAFMKKCGHSSLMGASVNNMLRNICLPGLHAPNVDFDEVCL